MVCQKTTKAKKGKERFSPRSLGGDMDLSTPWHQTSSFQSRVVVQLLSHVQFFAMHGLQHARLPCPSLTPRVCSNSCQGIYITISLSSSAGTKAPTQVKDGNFRLSIRFLRFPVALTSNFTYFKTSPPKPSGNSGFLSRSQASSFQSTAIKLSLLLKLWTYWSRSSNGGPRNLHFSSSPKRFWDTLKFENPWCRQRVENKLGRMHSVRPTQGEPWMPG